MRPSAAPAGAASRSERARLSPLKALGVWVALAIVGWMLAIGFATLAFHAILAAP